MQRLIDGLVPRIRPAIEHDTHVPIWDATDLERRNGRRALVARIIRESHMLMVADLPDFIVKTCSTAYLLSLLERDLQRVSGVWINGRVGKWPLWPIV